MEYSLAISELEKKQLKKPEAIVRQFSKYESYFPITILLSATKRGEFEYGNVERISAKGNQLFGQRIDSSALEGKNIQSLFTDLSGWMDPENFAGFVNDQKRIAVDYWAGREAMAKVPLKINNQHPSDAFRNKVFVPIIVVVTGKEEIEGGVQEFLIMLFLDVTKLPEGIFVRDVE